MAIRQDLLTFREAIGAQLRAEKDIVRQLIGQRMAHRRRT